jgi:hypothetical protein
MIKLSWYDYQLSLSYEIKYQYNRKVKLSVESVYFIRVSFHFIRKTCLMDHLFETLSVHRSLRALCRCKTIVVDIESGRQWAMASTDQPTETPSSIRYDRHIQFKLFRATKIISLYN